MYCNRDLPERCFLHFVPRYGLQGPQNDEEDGFFGLFGFTGKKTTGMFDGVLDMEGGYIKTDECMRTNIPGVFAAGDVRVTPLRQVVTACADGAIAAMQCYKYISAQK